MTEPSPTREPDPEEILEARLTIETPERVQIVYDLAGIGSRFAAGLIDTTLLVALWCGGVVILDIVEPDLIGAANIQDPIYLMAATAVLQVMSWLYFVLFEGLWGGKTPGKYSMQLRVVSEEGGPAPFSSVLVRNVLRILDGFPVVSYVPAGVVMFSNDRSKRIGDFAGGTVVVRERPTELALPQLAGGAPLAEVELDQLTPAERSMLRSFMRRRGEFTSESRAKIARQIADAVSERVPLPEVDPEELLRLLHQGKKPSELADYAGPSLPAEGAGG